MSGRNDAWAGAKRRLRLPDGRHLAYVDTGGPGPAFLLIHGYSDTSRSFQPLLPHLADRRLVLPDLPGHGDSDPLERPSPDRLADDMAALAGALKLLPRLVLGHSLGSLVALELAARDAFAGQRTVTLAATALPGLEGLDFLDPVSDFADPPGAEDAFFADWYAGPVALDPAFVGALRAEAGAMPKAVWLAYRDSLRAVDLRRRIGAIRTPLLCLSGGRDPIFGPAHADLLEACLPGARHLSLAGHGHNLHWEDAALTARLIREFAGIGEKAVQAAAQGF